LIIPQADHVTVVVLGVWSLLAMLPLAGFYLSTPVISSRYMMDFAPAFAVALAVVWLVIAACCQRRWSRVLACVLLGVWLSSQLYLSRPVDRQLANITRTEFQMLRDHQLASTQAPAGIGHDQTLNGPHSGIPFDGVGWERPSGALMPVVIVFVKDPEFFELDFETQPHPRIVANPENIRVKVGLEFLERTQITETGQGWRVRFRGPQQARWQKGVQSAFIATVPKEYLAAQSTPWKLKSAR
jgi:hypothetical protein